MLSNTSKLSINMGKSFFDGVSRMKTILSLTCIFLFAYIFIAGYLYVFQRDFLYFPTGQYDHSFERMSVLSQGETVEVIVLNKGRKNALLYFGGNGEAVVGNAAEFSSNFSDVTIYLINYRGYGGSSGEPTEAGIYADALTVYDKIAGHHSHIGVMGRSLGSGVATYLAVKRPIESVALITPFDSVLNLARATFGLFPIKLLLKDHYDSLSRAKNIKSKVLVIAAEHDQIIPMRYTKNLINEFKSDQVVLKIIKNEGHNSLSNNADYYKALSYYIKTLTST